VPRCLFCTVSPGGRPPTRDFGIDPPYPSATAVAGQRDGRFDRRRDTGTLFLFIIMGYDVSCDLPVVHQLGIEQVAARIQGPDADLAEGVKKQPLL